MISAIGWYGSTARLGALSNVSVRPQLSTCTGYDPPCDDGIAVPGEAVPGSPEPPQPDSRMAASISAGRTGAVGPRTKFLITGSPVDTIE